MEKNLVSAGRVDCFALYRRHKAIADDIPEHTETSNRTAATQAWSCIGILASLTSKTGDVASIKGSANAGSGKSNLLFASSKFARAERFGGVEQSKLDVVWRA